MQSMQGIVTIVQEGRFQLTDPEGVCTLSCCPIGRR